jgi:hypothetical protein
MSEINQSEMDLADRLRINKARGWHLDFVFRDHNLYRQTPGRAQRKDSKLPTISLNTSENVTQSFVHDRNPPH